MAQFESLTTSTKVSFIMDSVSNDKFNHLMDFCYYFKIYFYVLAAIASLLFVFLLYLIFYVTPKEIKSVNWFILNCVITNYAMILVYLFWQSVTLFPFLGGFCLGVLRYLGIEGMHLGLNLFTISIICIILSNLGCQTHKVVLFQPPGPI